MSDTGRESREGTEFGRYRLRRLIGRGGMGEVYEAEDTTKDRIVALKLLPEAVSHDPVFRKRLRREAQSAGRLQEPHVVPIHDYGEIDGVMFVDMRMIDGTDLRKILKQFGPMTPARAVAIVRQIGSALDAAHESGITHRDVKPENILVTGEDFAYLVDFGLANAATDEKLTELGTAVGTYAYMAPERFTSDEVTYRADIYALTCVLHECLTGSPPYPADSVSVIITAHLMQPIPRPSARRPGISTAFDRVIATGMAKRPQDRYASAGDLANAAYNALSERDQNRATTIVQRSLDGRPPTLQPGQPIHQTPPHPAALHPPPSGPPHSGNKVPWIPIAAATGVFVLALGALAIWLLVKPDETSSPSPTTTATPNTTETRPTPRTTTSEQPSDSKLQALLPQGYDEGACQTVRPPVAGALATVDCGPSSIEGGPVNARYSLFANQATLDAQFDSVIGENSELSQCPNSGIDSPTSWHYTGSPDDIEGRIACGTYQDRPDLVWSKNADLVLADAQGPNMDDLHNWWLKYTR